MNKIVITDRYLNDYAELYQQYHQYTSTSRSNLSKKSKSKDFFNLLDKSKYTVNSDFPFIQKNSKHERFISRKNQHFLSKSKKL